MSKHRNYKFGEIVIVDDGDFLVEVCATVVGKHRRDSYTVAIYGEGYGLQEFTVKAAHMRLSTPPKFKTITHKSEEVEE